MRVLQDDDRADDDVAAPGDADGDRWEREDRRL
jgi:hypothetical protein